MNLNDLRSNAYGKNSNQKPLFKNVNEQVDKIFNADRENVEVLSKEGLLKVPAPESKDSVYRRVAKFLVLIGVEQASKIMPLLSAEQTEKIVSEIATIKSVGENEAVAILEEFQGLYKTVTERGGKETARAILEKVYGPEKAVAMLEKAAPYKGNKPFEYLNDAKKEKILHLLSDESCAVKALVLSNLEPKKAASVINLMNDKDKTEVVRRLAKMESISPEVLKKVDQAMHEKSLAMTDDDRSETLDGKNALAQILKQMNADAESEILANISNEDPDLAQDLKSRLFTIDDILNADEKFIQEKLRDYPATDIARLVAGKPETFKQKIFSCISSGKRTEVFEEQEISGHFLKSECEKITNMFFNEMRTAYDEGKLIIKGRNDDIYV